MKHLREQNNQIALKWPKDAARGHCDLTSLNIKPLFARLLCPAGLMAGLSVTLSLTGPSAAAQTSAELEIRTYAGLTITGEIGRVYSIEYKTDLAEPATSGWRCLEYLQLPASPFLWADKSAPATGKRFYRAVAMEPPENMVFIPPGTFRMGSPQDELGRSENEGPQTAVTITRGFWMGKYEVTAGEYMDVMESDSDLDGGEAHYPALMVSWDNAVAYCVVLTERERAAGRIAPNSVYRLPTEAEWEYACRAGTSTRFSHGEDLEGVSLTHYAWYGGEGIHAVGEKLSNPWELYDMHGNVLEWCQDWWAPSLPGGIVADPEGPSVGSYRVIRGGASDATYFIAKYCRSAFRAEGVISGGRRVAVGFRVVLAPV